MSVRTPLGAAALVLVVLSFAACSSSSSSSSASSASGSNTTSPSGSTDVTMEAGGRTIPKADFITQADGLCAKLNPQVAAIKAPGDPTTATADQLPAWGTYLDQLLPLATSGTQQLAALPLPDKDTDKIVSARKSEAAAVTDAQHADDAAKAGNLDDFKAAITQLTTDSQKGTKLETDFGLKVCGSGA